jgi:type II secretory pathway component GspD/PulD (secretin)
MDLNVGLIAWGHGHQNAAYTRKGRSVDTIFSPMQTTIHRLMLTRTGRLVLACGGALAVGCVGEALGQTSTPPPTPAPRAQPQPSRPPGMELTPEQLMEAQRRAAAAMEGGDQPEGAPAAANRREGLAEEGRSGLEGAGEVVTLSAFTEPVQLSNLVDLVATTLNINVVIKGELPGSVVFNAPVPVPKAELLDLLDSLLEQHGWSIVQDRFGIYNVQPAGDVKVNLTGDKPTTRVISTPNVRPSSLRPAIDTQLGVLPGQPGQPGGAKHTYIDELGVIIVTDTPRRLALLEQFIGLVLSEQAKAQFIRLPLTHVSAAVARERALQLVGLMAQPTRSSGAPDATQQAQLLLQQQQQIAAQAGSVSNLNNMGERLTIDPTGNALIFRGQPEEINAVRSILTIIDRPSDLVPRSYFAGSGAQQIADLARGRGLGEIITISSQGNDQFGNAFGGINPQTGLPFQQNNGASLGGPMMVVDESKGTIVYYGTAEQQAQLDELIRVHDTNSEQVTIEVYKLRNSKAEDVAEVIQNLLSGTQPLGDAPLLPGGTGTNRAANRGINRGRTLEEQLGIQQQQPGQQGEGLSIDESGFVIADEKNNQILVKAPRGQQAEYEKLIAKLDLRRLQVFIEAKIVAITADDRTRLAFETQLINANGSGGVLNTNFGLGSFGTTGTQPILTPKVVGTGLSGFTAAIIRSDQVPIIMTALANETDSRIIATPQLLVNDNEEASVVSKDEVPYSTTTQNSGNNQVTGFGGYAEAGTELTVTPTISDTSNLRLEYAIEQSSFTGEAANGLPPPKQTNTLESASINVPSDSTVIVGGLVVNSKTRTKLKVPLIGDIPIVGALFADDRKGNRETVLYVFLTPRILRDPGFEDLRLLTRGPQSRVQLDPDMPSLMPTTIDIRPTPVRGTPGVMPISPARQEPADERGGEPARRPPSRVEPGEPNPD